MAKTTRVHYEGIWEHNKTSRIFRTIGNNSIFMDASTKSITAQGDPKELLKNPPNKEVYEFLTRGKENPYEKIDRKIKKGKK